MDDDVDAISITNVPGRRSGSFREFIGQAQIALLSARFTGRAVLGDEPRRAPCR